MPGKRDISALTRRIRATFETSGLEAAAAVVWREAGQPGDVRPVGAEPAVLEAYLQSLLNAHDYSNAGVLLWGERVFNPKPRSVARIIRMFGRSNRGLILGAGSVGKSFTIAALFYLWWRHDPLWTAIKVISQTREHGKRNIFATILWLHNSAMVPLLAKASDGVIRADPLDERHGIQQVAIAKGTGGVGILKGFHPIPRPERHPIHGDSTRVAAILDEGEHIPDGVWTGCDNMLLASDGEHHGNVKVFCVTNPVDQNSIFATRSEPPGGWAGLELDNDEEWRAPSGYDVLRVDAAKCENVVLNRVVFPGFITRQGFDGLVLANGIESATYFTLLRGTYPRQGAAFIIIPQAMLDKMVGGYIWQAPPQPIGSLDPALEGGDKPVLSVGKTGIATHWFSIPRNWREGDERTLVQFKEPARVVLLEAQFQLHQGDSVAVAAQAVEICNTFGILPHLFAVDATGTGEGVSAQLRHTWGDIIVVVNSESPTEKRILTESKTRPCDDYVNIATELWFALRLWAQFNLVKVVPSALSRPLQAQVVRRRYLPVGQGKVRTRKKSEDTVNNKSPDEADSFTLLVHAARQARAGIEMTAQPERAKQRDKEVEESKWEAERIARKSRMPFIHV